MAFVIHYILILGIDSKPQFIPFKKGQTLAYLKAAVVCPHLILHSVLFKDVDGLQEGEPLDVLGRFKAKIPWRRGATVIRVIYACLFNRSLELAFSALHLRLWQQLLAIIFIVN